MASSGRGLISVPLDHTSATRMADMTPMVEGKLVGLDDGSLDSEFDASKKPPFTLGQIRATIPKHCWGRSMGRSFYYVVQDVAIVATLAVVAAYVDSWILWPLYWFAQGTVFWAVFVIGHDCGHGAFSSSRTVNNIVGHVLHSFILVPYHGWSISHRNHHAGHGHVERDESWYPMTESMYKAEADSIFQLNFWRKFARSQTPLQLFVWPGYLWTRGPGTTGSHYIPWSAMFDANEWLDVKVSSSCWLAMVGCWVWASSSFGLLWLFPHYHLLEATAAVKPLLGKYYREPEKSPGPVPLHLFRIIFKSFSEDHFVPDEGDVVFYQKDTKSQ